MNSEKTCCPRFDPTLWDEKTIEWNSKKFIKDRVCTLLYMPLNFGGTMKRVYERVGKAGATIQDGMWLSDHTSPWNINLYVAVDTEISGAENVTLSGTFLSKVYAGKFRDTGVWMKDFHSYANSRNLSIKKVYMWYTTCPECSKKYGKNYVVLIADVRTR